MADEDTKLILSISADITQLRRQMKEAGVIVEKTAKQTEDSFKKTGPAADNAARQVAASMDKAGRQTEQVVRNLTFQLNDVSTGLLSGTSPFTIMAQQTSQVTQALNGLGQGTSKIGAIIGALRSMISVQTLVVGGLIYAGAAAFQYFTKSNDEAKKGETIWTRHAAAVASMKEAYGKAAEGLDEYSKKSVAVAEYEKARDKEALRKTQTAIQKETISGAGPVVKLNTREATMQLRELKRALDEALYQKDFAKADQIKAQMADLSNVTKRLSAGTLVLRDSYKELAPEINAYIKSIKDSKDGNGDLLGLVDALAKRYLTADENLKKTIDTFMKANDEGIKAAQALKAYADSNITSWSDLKTLLEGLGGTTFAGMKTVYVENIGLMQTATDGFLSNLTTGFAKAFDDINAHVRGTKILMDQFKDQPLPGMGQLPPLGSFNGKLMDSYEAQNLNDNIVRTADGAKAYLNSIKVGAANVDRLNDAFAQKLAMLVRDFPDMNVISGYRSKELQAQLYANRKPGQMVAKPGSSLHEPGLAADLGYKGQQQLPPYYEALVKRAEEIGLKPLKGDPMHFQDVSATADAFKTTSTKATKEKTDALQEAIRTTKESTSVMDAEAKSLDYYNTKMDESTYKREFMAKQQELMNVAARDGTGATEAERLKIIEVADAYAKAEASKKQYSITSKDVTRDAKLDAQQLAAVRDQLAGMATSFTTGFISSMREGKSATEALGDALANLADQLLQMAVNSLFKNLFGALLGSPVTGGGGFFGGVAHQGGTVGAGMPRRNVNPAVFAGAQRYHRGGVAGLRAGEVPIIAQRGEVILPKSMKAGGSGGNAPVSYSTSLGDVNIDMSKSGAVAADNDSAKQFGANVQRLVQAEMIRESRPGGLLRQTPR
jgi:hypothetical protein